MVQYSKFDSEMKPETISKNGASSKNLMSRGNFFGRVFFTLFVASVVLSGCNITGIKGNGNIESQERKAGEFNGILLEGVANINIHPDSDYKVVVITDSNIQDIIVVENKNGILDIRQKDKANIHPTKLEVEVYLPKLKSIQSNGVGSINISAGTASDLDINLSGVGAINSQDYQVDNITITLSGVGSAKIWATSSLNGNLSGVGSILYKGNPTINVNRSGVGSINHCD